MSDKREKIIEAAITLFARDGFWKTSTASIAKQAGVATGTLFNYFASKESLINQVYLELKREGVGRVIQNRPLEADLRSNIGHMWRGFINWALDNPMRYGLLEQLKISELVSSETKTELAREYAFMHDMMMAARDAGEIVDIPLDYHFQIIGGQLTAAISFLGSPEAVDEDRAALIEEGFAVYWRGISKSTRT